MHNALPQLLLSCFLAPLVAAAAQDTIQFLVKLRTTVDTRETQVGTPVEAVVISPERLRGAVVAGTVRESQGNRLLLIFDRLWDGSRGYLIHGQLGAVVNSKGNRGVDDLDQPVRIEEGVIISEGPNLRLEEGAELRFATEKLQPTDARQPGGS